MADITAGSDLGVCGESWWSTFSREREEDVSVMSVGIGLAG